MDLKILPPPSSGLQPQLLSAFDPSETMGALQQALVQAFFGEEEEEVAGCVVGAFGNTSGDPSQLLSDFLDVDGGIMRMVSQPVDADKKALGYSQDRPRFTIHVQKWTGRNATEKVDEDPEEEEDEAKAKTPPPPKPARPPARRRSRETVLRIVEAVDEPAPAAARPPCTLDLSAVSNASAPMKFLIGIDGSEGAHLGFTAAMELFNVNTNDSIEVLHIFDKSKAYLPFDLKPEYIRQQYDLLLLPVPTEQKAVTLIAKPDDPDADFSNFEIVTKSGTKGLVCRYANDPSWPDGIDGVPTHDKPDLLVVGFIGRKGPKQDPTILGSCVDYSIRSAACSSLVVKKRGVTSTDNTRKYCVAVDGSAASHHAFVEALRVMDRIVDEIVVVTFCSANRTREDAKRDTDLMTQYDLALGEVGCKRGGVKLVEKEVGVSFGRALSAFAFDNDIGVLCVGADGMKAFSEGRSSTHLGSVSDYCVKHAKCSVLIAQINTVV